MGRVVVVTVVVAVVYRAVQSMGQLLDVEAKAAAAKEEEVSLNISLISLLRAETLQWPHSRFPRDPLAFRPPEQTNTHHPLDHKTHTRHMPMLKAEIKNPGTDLLIKLYNFQVRCQTRAVIQRCGTPIQRQLRRALKRSTLTRIRRVRPIQDQLWRP